MKRRIVSLAAAFWLLAAPVFAAPDPLEQRVDKLEGEIAALRRDMAELRQLLEQVAGQLPGSAAAGLEQRVGALEAQGSQLGQKAEELGAQVRDQGDSLNGLTVADQKRAQVSTYGTFNAVDSDQASSVYDAEAFEIVLSGQPSERLGFFAEIEFERAASTGGPRGGEVLVEQAYASFALTRRLNLRAGVLLVPFGNVNIDHYAPNRDVISKPLVSYAVAPSDWTDNGFGLQGSVLLGGADSLAFEVYSVAGLDANISAVGTRAARQPFGEDNNNNKALVGRLAWDHAGEFQLGLSGYTGKVDDAGRERLDGWALDGSWQRGPLSLTGEYDRFESDTGQASKLLLEGWYTRATYRLPLAFLRRGQHAASFPDAHIDLVAQYDRARIEGSFAGVPEKNVEWRRTFGLNYHPSHQWVLKLDHEESESSGRPLQFGIRKAWLGSIGFQF